MNLSRFVFSFINIQNHRFLLDLPFFFNIIWSKIETLTSTLIVQIWCQLSCSFWLKLLFIELYYIIVSNLCIKTIYLFFFSILSPYTNFIDQRMDLFTPTCYWSLVQVKYKIHIEPLSKNTVWVEWDVRDTIQSHITPLSIISPNCQYKPLSLVNGLQYIQLSIIIIIHLNLILVFKIVFYFFFFLKSIYIFIN